MNRQDPSERHLLAKSRQDWRELARCAGYPTNTFYELHSDNMNARAAKEFCRQCPVISQCLEYALEMHEFAYGIWGGTTPKQRRKLVMGRLKLDEVKALAVQIDR